MATEPHGLTALIIPQSDETLADIMSTPTATRLIGRGAKLYLLKDGVTNCLAMTPPPGALARAWGMGGRGLRAAPCA